ncbi:6-phospho-3-hexuloisomerase [Pseudarthrobacter sp. NS4]|uniref:6-phospho-3-hexuloisomerase n=1 Tax=Pseudarthrobacter sp. NS4 TaxID=2973976 RepID=UPI00216182B4|nr:6-phospho-3-hexuloisomerase [Pseudarthrobacter sp. NS4]
MESTVLTAPAVEATGEAIAGNISLVLTEIADTSGNISPLQLDDAAAELGRASRVFVAGAGRSGLVLRMAAMRLMHLGLVVHVAGDTTTPAIREGDLLLVASGSGTTSGVVKAAETASKAQARIVAFTANPGSPLAGLADAVVVLPAQQKTDHGSGVSRQYSGSLFEQVLFVATEALFHSLWDTADVPAEQLWLRHANLE